MSSDGTTPVAGSATDAGNAPWALVIAPDRRGAAMAIAGAWALCGLVGWLASSTGDGDASPYGWIAVAPFALVVTWYGLKTSVFASGTIRIDAAGFSISRAGQPAEAFAWDAIESFHVARFGTSPFFQGRASPHFRVKGEADERSLPQTGGYNAARLTAMMAHCRHLAAARWPHHPESVPALAAEAARATPDTPSP